jgi:hypothetical protein
MKATYYNRYNVKITFEHTKNQVVMSGKGLTTFMRYGFPNVYTDAYIKYVESAVVDAKLESNQILTEKEFREVLFVTKDEDSFESNALLKLFGKYIYSDTKTIDMVDPSGGPYLTVGSNLKYFFNDKVDRIVDKIKIGEDKITFKLK